jgi:3-deoxy-7-phosphoheptulonate synthase
MASKIFNGEKRIIKVRDLEFGANRKILISGPCSVESYDQIMEIAKELKSVGIDVLRGGAFKPRTSPYSFQGLGEEGLKFLREAADSIDVPVVTEVMDEGSLEVVCKYADIIQVGSRNMHNYSLLKTLGSVKKPILLKRGMSSTIHEWIMAAEYLAHYGNDQIILCERGIRTFDNYTRNTLDIAAIPIMKAETGLPVIVDPSHGTGIRKLIEPMSMAGLIAGADGVMVEVHTDPDNALSDADQTIDINQYRALVSRIKNMY